MDHGAAPWLAARRNAAESARPFTGLSERPTGDSLELSINGQMRPLDDAAVAPDMPLLWALRDVLNLTGTKFGCGIAACGACTTRTS